MIDEQVDREFKRIAGALTGLAPDAIVFDGAAPPKQVAWTSARVATAAFAVVLAMGSATLFLVSRSGDTHPTSGEGSRWEWILASTVATDDPELRLADPAATPVAQFDYTALGVEQPLTLLPDPREWDWIFAGTGIGSGDPSHPLLVPEPPVVHVGGVEGTPIDGYLFRGWLKVSPLGGLDRWVISLAVGSRGGGGGIGGHEDSDPLPGDGIISGMNGGPSDGRITVDLWVPRDTAVVVLTLDDGRSFVQRPMVGIAIFVITDLGTAGIASAAALDASGATLIFEDFTRMWADIVLIDADTTP